MYSSTLRSSCPESRISRRALGWVLEQGVGEPALAVLAVVKDVNRAGCAPGIDRGDAHTLGPPGREAKGRRQQYHARHFRMPGGVERGEVASQAAADERHRVAGGGAFDHAQLAADGEVLEIAGREIGDVDQGTRGAQACGEELGFAGPWR